jgi:hypothetical protein
VSAALVALAALLVATAGEGPAAPPVLPALDPATRASVRTIAARGRALGARDGSVAKVGDSITESRAFLHGYACGATDLGGRPGLQRLVARIRAVRLPRSLARPGCGESNPFSRESATGVSGWTADRALTPAAVPPPGCRAGETPLACEYRLLRPALAVIMYGTNDLARFGDTRRFRRDLTRIVRFSAGRGVVPILSTIPPRLDAPAYAGRVAAYNAVVVDVGRTERVPLVNYWRALSERLGPGRGLHPDGVHPDALGGCAPTGPCRGTDLTPAGLRHGYNVRNLVTLEALARVGSVIAAG